jgi:hypothetical protein
MMSTGRSRYAKPRFQIDCHAATPTAAQAVADAVKLAVDGFSGTVLAVPIGSSALEDERDAPAEASVVTTGGARVYSRQLDVLIGHAEP